MTILFICGCLEIGKNGVGDYVRILASNIAQQGIKVGVVAINDFYVAASSATEQLTQQHDDTLILRLSAKQPYPERGKLLRQFIMEHKPDVVSLQFVPYGFHKKGLPIVLAKELAKLKVKKWHIMFHELWVGMEKDSDYKAKVTGYLQKKIITYLISKLQPSVIHTSNSLYVAQLNSITKLQTSILPLFGNIKKQFNRKSRRDVDEKDFKVMLFAGIHYGAPIGGFLKWLVNETAKMSLVANITFVGRNGPGLSDWEEELKKQNVPYKILGAQEDAVISKLLSEADLGISTTPYYLLDKSGSVAAMLEHGLPVLCVSRTWTPTYPIDLSLLKTNRIMAWQRNLRLAQILEAEISYHTPDSISKQYIKDLGL